jgi:peptidoglycan/LPS O-acetylase OafA/YrhL
MGAVWNAPCRSDSEIRLTGAGRWSSRAVSRLVLNAFVRLGYRPALDGIRGIAIALVLLHHITRTPASTFLGVQGFFVLSGFLITTLLLEEHVTNGRISLGRFYQRRALRLLPALVAALLGYLFLAALFGTPPLHTALRGVAFGLAYCTNVLEALSPTLVPVSIGHLWSLATEEQFYLLWPPLLILALRRRVRPRTLVGLLLAFAAAAAIDRATLSLLGFGWRRVYYAPDTTFDAILIGCAVGVCYRFRLGPSVATIRTMSRAALVVVPLLLFFSTRLTYLVGAVPFELGFAAIVLAAAHGADSELDKALAWKPLAQLGRISYGVYLWDWIILSITPATGLAAAVISIGVAAASYRWIESPFLRLKRRTKDESSVATERFPRPIPVHPS